MLYEYDKALERKFLQVYNNVVYAPVNRFYERYLLNHDNKTEVKLPAISIWRTNYEFDTVGAIAPLTIPKSIYRGYRYDEVNKLYSIPVRLTYQIDLWASSDIERDDLLKEVMYYLLLDPEIYVKYDNLVRQFAIQLDDPEDTTDISNFDAEGDMFRVTIPLRIPDAQLLFTLQ